MIGKIKRFRAFLRLPIAAQLRSINERCRVASQDPGIDATVREALAWLGSAQDCSASQDGGAARHYSLIDGWGTSYPETTGYIIPTMINCSHVLNDASLRERAKHMLDWLVGIQFPEGGFQGGTIEATPCVPVTFNTGQILIGLAAGVREFGNKYAEPMHRAADWLATIQDADGCWRSHPTPFAAPGDKVYETHVAWGLLEAARVAPNPHWSDAALRNIHWALSHQHENGWFDHCCLEDPTAPLTHTLGYVLRGILEAYRFTNDGELLDAGRRAADGILSAFKEDGFLPGRLDCNWQGTVSWACLTGTVQLAYCFLMLYEITNHSQYLSAAKAANAYVRCTVRTEGNLALRGGIQGSWPIDGGYCRLQYPNWAAKFFIDAQLYESKLI
jgi:hypothetical protein